MLILVHQLSNLAMLSIASVALAMPVNNGKRIDDLIRNEKKYQYLLSLIIVSGLSLIMYILKPFGNMVDMMLNVIFVLVSLILGSLITENVIYNAKQNKQKPNELMLSLGVITILNGLFLGAKLSSQRLVVIPNIPIKSVEPARKTSKRKSTRRKTK
jgi:uncharacterized membrane protein